MTPQQAHELKLKMALFAEKTAMLAFAQPKDAARWELALAERDQSRNDVYAYIDSLTTEN